MHINFTGFCIVSPFLFCEKKRGAAVWRIAKTSENNTATKQVANQYRFGVFMPCDRCVRKTVPCKSFLFSLFLWSVMILWSHTNTKIWTWTSCFGMRRLIPSSSSSLPSFRRHHHLCYYYLLLLLLLLLLLENLWSRI